MLHETLKFIIVEDDPSQIEVIRFRLNESNAKNIILHEFPSGEEALNYLQTEDSELPDIIILDLNLPGKDGLTVLKEIKSSERLKHISVIVNTASLEKDDIVQSYRSGGTFFMNKEWDEDIFRDAVTQIRVINKKQ